MTNPTMVTKAELKTSTSASGSANPNLEERVKVSNSATITTIMIGL